MLKKRAEEEATGNGNKGYDGPDEIVLRRSATRIVKSEAVPRCHGVKVNQCKS
jgi:hypothetical protein